MRKIIWTLAFGMYSLLGISQIRFEEKSEDNDLLQRARSADSAILAGEFGQVHSLLIVKNQKLLFENYYNQWPADSLHQLQSATKSIVSALLGCALQRGIISSEQDLVAQYFPQYTIGDSLLKRLKIKDLLTQRHGLAWNEGAWNDPDNTWRKIIEFPGDWYRRILDRPMDTLPGTRFNYSNAAPLLVSGLIQTASNMPIDSFAIQYLFRPLDIKRYGFWRGNGGPQNNGLALLSLTTRDMAKIGQLYLQQGQWEGAQILPTSYVNTSTSALVENVGSNGAYKRYDYGYFWWCNPVTQNDHKSSLVLARGAGGQNIMVDYRNQAVIVITAWNMQQPNKPQLIYDWYLSNPEQE